MRCACLVAECRRTTVPTTIGGRKFDHDTRVEESYSRDRYASDALGRCANSQLDLLRLEVLQRYGGLVLDLDVFVLRSLDSWRHCAADAVIGWGSQLARHGGQVSNGVMMGRARAQFFQQWRRRLLRTYQPGQTDFGRLCNLSTVLAAARPHQVHTAAELGPLPRYYLSMPPLPLPSFLYHFSATKTPPSTCVPEPSPSFLGHNRSSLPRSSLLAPRSSLLAPRSLLLVPCSSLLAPRSLLLAPRSSLLAPCSLLLAPCSSLLAPCSSLLAPRSLLLAPCSSLCTPQPHPHPHPHHHHHHHLSPITLTPSPAPSHPHPHPHPRPHPRPHPHPHPHPHPRYASRELYDEHLALAPLVHLSAFRHAWRLRDIMVHRHLEAIVAVVLSAANRSQAHGFGPQLDSQEGAQLRECIRTIGEACWAKPGKRCGIYGA